MKEQHTIITRSDDPTKDRIRQTDEDGESILIARGAEHVNRAIYFIQRIIKKDNLELEKKELPSREGEFCMLWITRDPPKCPEPVDVLRAAVLE